MMNRIIWGRCVSIILSLTVLLLIGSSCDDNPVATGGLVIPTPDGMLDAPTQLTINGHSYKLQTVLWRDFQPVSPPNGKPLIGLAWLSETDSLTIPSNVTMDYLWVVNGGQTWATNFSDEERPSQPDYRLEEIAREGPKWGPGITVAVVARVRTGDDETYRILVMDQAITRTD